MLEAFKAIDTGNLVIVLGGIAMLVILWFIFGRSKKKPTPKKPKTHYDYNMLLLEEIRKEMELQPNSNIGKILINMTIVETATNRAGQPYTKNPSMCTSKEVYERVKRTNFEQTYNENKV